MVAGRNVSFNLLWCTPCYRPHLARWCGPVTLSQVEVSGAGQATKVVQSVALPDGGTVEMPVLPLLQVCFFFLCVALTTNTFQVLSGLFHCDTTCVCVPERAEQSGKHGYASDCFARRKQKNTRDTGPLNGCPKCHY